MAASAKTIQNYFQTSVFLTTKERKTSFGVESFSDFVVQCPHVLNKFEKESPSFAKKFVFLMKNEEHMGVSRLLPHPKKKKKSPTFLPKTLKQQKQLVTIVRLSCR